MNNHVFCFPVSTFKTLLQMNIYLQDKTEVINRTTELCKGSWIWLYHNLKMQQVLKGCNPSNKLIFILNQLFNQILHFTKLSYSRQKKKIDSCASYIT